jgi:hypothetical protein
VSFNGIGEGDSDNAYALVTLTPREGESPVAAEVLLSRLSGRWQITQQSSQQLVKAAKEICTK